MSAFSIAASSFACSLFRRHTSIARVSRYKPAVHSQGFVTSTTPSHRLFRTLKPARLPSVSRTQTTVFALTPAPATIQHRQFVSALFTSRTMTIAVPTTQTDIIAQLPARFDQAKEAGDLFFFPSTVHKHLSHGVEVCEFRWPVCTGRMSFDPGYACSSRSRYAPR